ncbi:DUF3108 domain-containing protein [Marinobacter zhejiangensis]|uniref:DUF3108 domain-containing protein n=1 Tax=Marinobacter zhejiangensis TaxID=488535 RepID=A0A1I4RBQ4_9GAMM|nr:DUF3108 domain-containing protein [Marinobacter zhejiangensis]SFM49657.1 Protein of unknown function [Marinobacter zhejiangensis]
MPPVERQINGIFAALTACLFLVMPLIASAAEEQAPDTIPQASSDYPDLIPYTASFRASFDKGVAIDGKATRVLQRQEDGLWSYRFNVDSFIADIEERVIFRWDGQQIQPLRYRYRLSGVFIRDRTRAIDFDWTNGVARGDHEGRTFNLPLREGSLDPLGYQLQLHQDIRAGLTEMTYQVIDKGRFDEDHFAVIGEETLSTRLGEARTVKVEKVRSEGSKRETLMWFAPEWDHMMVRLTQREPDGTTYEIHIENTSLNQDG